MNKMQSAQELEVCELFQMEKTEKNFPRYKFMIIVKFGNY